MNAAFDQKTADMLDDATAYNQTPSIGNFTDYFVDCDKTKKKRCLLEGQRRSKWANGVPVLIQENLVHEVIW